MLQLKYRNRSFSCLFFIEILSVVVKVFFPGEKGRMRRVRGCSVSLTALTSSDYPKTWRVQSPWQLFFPAERWLRLAWQWTQKELKQAWRMHKGKWCPKPRFDEMSDKTVEIRVLLESYLGLCAFEVMGSASFKQPSQEGQETFINYSLQQNWQNSRQKDVHESQRTRRLIW